MGKSATQRTSTLTASPLGVKKDPLDSAEAIQECLEYSVHARTYRLKYLIVTQRTSSRAQADVGSLVQVSARIAMLLLSVLLMGYLARSLGTAEYGRYAISVVLMNWLTLTIAVATGGATVRLVAGKENGIRYGVSMLQMVAVLSTALAVVIALAAQPLADLLPTLRIDPPVVFRKTPS